MSYKIVVDSCCDLTPEHKKDSHFEVIPLELQVGGYRTPDDETFDRQDFLKRIAASPECPKSACPSPERFMQAYEGADDIYAVTLSANLSGSYNSAVLGKNLYEEKHGRKNIHIFNSCSAASGEVQIALFIRELAEAGESFETIVKKGESFRADLDTYFVLDNLETLRKNGRLSGVKALVASTLKIKPLMGANKEGVIIQRGQSIGINKALGKMVDMIIKDKPDAVKRRLVIAHCNNRERAEKVKELLVSKAAFLEILIVETAGISTMYANDGGIIIAV